jgi:hypothetical protein
VITHVCPACERNCRRSNYRYNARLLVGCDFLLSDHSGQRESCAIVTARSSSIETCLLAQSQVSRYRTRRREGDVGVGQGTEPRERGEKNGLYKDHLSRKRVTKIASSDTSELWHADMASQLGRSRQLTVGDNRAVLGGRSRRGAGERHATAISTPSIHKHQHSRYRNHGRTTVAPLPGDARHGHGMSSASPRLCAANRARYGALSPPAAELLPAAQSWALAGGNAVIGMLCAAIYRVEVRILMEI